jgi:hypothetical protein
MLCACLKILIGKKRYVTVVRFVEADKMLFIINTSTNHGFSHGSFSHTLLTTLQYKCATFTLQAPTGKLICMQNMKA